MRICPTASGWRAVASTALPVAMPMPTPAPKPVNAAMPAPMKEPKEAMLSASKLKTIVTKSSIIKRTSANSSSIYKK